MSTNKRLPRLPFGLRAGRLYTVTEVPRGLGCGCVCPACGSPLLAKQGKRYAPHFAHHRAPACSNATETALHLFAKHVIRERGRVYVPNVVLPHTGKVLRYRRLWIAERCAEEVTLGELRADLLLQNGADRLAVEIKVHHAKARYQIKQFMALRLAALEIDVARIFQDLLAQRGHRWRVRDLRNAILYGARYRRWLFHPQQHAAEYALRKQTQARPVKHYRQGDRHHYYVFGCPLKAEDRYPTDIWQRCAHCRHCFEIEYSAEWQGYRYVVKSPRRVLCLARREKESCDL